MVRVRCKGERMMIKYNQIDNVIRRYAYENGRFNCKKTLW